MKLLQRVCWNEYQWRGPSGHKLGRENSYPGEYGFGHEEWNFNTAQLLSGQVCGYIYYNPPQDSPTRSEKTDIYFFAIDPRTRMRALVGVYRKARFLTQAERRSRLKEAERTGILEQRAEEVAALPDSRFDSVRALTKLREDFSLNVAVSPEDVEVLDPPVALTAPLLGGRDPRHLNRYTTPLFLDALRLSKGVPVRAQNQGTTSDLLTDAYVRITPAQRKVVERRHNRLSNVVRRWLEERGASEVRAEKERIDVTCRFGRSTCLFELKTIYRQTTRQAVREAIGQVLDYAYSPGRASVDFMAILLDQRATEADIDWVRRLGGAGLPIELMWQVERGFESARTNPNTPAKLR